MPAVELQPRIPSKSTRHQSALLYVSAGGVHRYTSTCDLAGIVPNMSNEADGPLRIARKPSLTAGETQ
jgi:hypothetical protein